jgi:hypothetical protein
VKATLSAYFHPDLGAALAAPVDYHFARRTTVLARPAFSLRPVPLRKSFVL